MFSELRASLLLLAFLTLLTGIGYPWLVTGIGQTLFPDQANGSLVRGGGRIIGSRLIAQNFTGDRYFHPRPSAAGIGYDATNSSGSNLAPSSRDLLATVAARIDDAAADNNTRPVPVDMVTASGSGLDPDISVAAALFQAPRVAAARNLPPQKVQELVAAHTMPPDFGFIGQARVNVLGLNRALDALPATP